MLGPQKFGWATKLLSVVAQVATAILKLVYIPALEQTLITQTQVYSLFQLSWPLKENEYKVLFLLTTQGSNKCLRLNTSLILWSSEGQAHPTLEKSSPFL